MSEPWRTDRWFASPWNFAPDAVERLHFPPDFIAYPPENRADLLGRASCLRRVIKGPMDAPDRDRQNRARFTGAVTDCDHEIALFKAARVENIGRLLRDIDSDLRHHLNGERVNNMTDVFRIADRDGHVTRFSLMSMGVEIVLDGEMLPEANARLAALYGLPDLRCPVLNGFPIRTARVFSRKLSLYPSGAELGHSALQRAWDSSHAPINLFLS